MEAELEDPRCAHFGKCGGCRWQDLAYEEQLRIKEQVLGNRVQPSPDRYRYRNRMEFSFSQSRTGDRFLGLYRKGKGHRVEDLNHCHLVDPWMSEALAATRMWWEQSGLLAYYPCKDTGSLRTLNLRHGVHTDARLAYLTLSGNPEYALKKEQLHAWMEAMETVCGEIGLFARVEQFCKGRSTQFYEIHLAGMDVLLESISVRGKMVHYQLAPTAFFQPNTKVAELIANRVVDYVEGAKSVLDLYCGVGFLGIAAAPYVGRVVGIELMRESALDAQENVRLNGCENVEIHHGDTYDLLSRLDLPKIEVVIVDPPRVGLGEKVVNLLVTLQPETIVYVSSNPKTQEVDICRLGHQGYRLVEAEGFDQFPHTAHIENVALLQKNV